MTFNELYSPAVEKGGDAQKQLFEKYALGNEVVLLADYLEKELLSDIYSERQELLYSSKNIFEVCTIVSIRKKFHENNPVLHRLNINNNPTGIAKFM